MTAFSTAILHCRASTERVANVRSLRAAIPDAIVVEDDGSAIGATFGGRRRGCWPLAARGWAARDPSRTHHLVLEDDAVLCDDFARRVGEVIKAAPAACLSLFRGARSCSVATILPTDRVDELIAWASTSKRGARTLQHHSWILSRGPLELGIPRLFAAPSLVEHGRFESLLDHPHLAALRFEQSPAFVTVEK